MSIERLDKSLKILVRYRSNHQSLMKMKTSLINTLEDLMEKRPVKQKNQKSEILGKICFVNLEMVFPKSFKTVFIRIFY